MRPTFGVSGRGRSDRLTFHKAYLVRLPKGKLGGELGIDGYCIIPSLLVVPDDVQPRPWFDLKPSRDLERLHEVRSIPGIYLATVTGRFDYAGVVNGRLQTYGRYRARFRFVLKEVRDLVGGPIGKK